MIEAATVLTYLQNTLGIILVFGVVVFIHELGHFLVAKRAGIKVEKFSFGFGREIFGFTKGETRYTVNWLPLGGYVKMAGETPEDYEGPVLEGKAKGEEQTGGQAAEDHSRDFMAQPWYRRIMVAVAGPLMNYLLAVLVFFCLFLIWGEPVQTNKTEIGDVMAGMPAQKAGLQKGDHIVKVNGRTVSNFMEISELIAQQTGQPTEVVVHRDGKEFSFEITPLHHEEEGRGLIGIRAAEPRIEDKKIGVGASLSKAFYQCWFISALTVDHLYQKLVAWEKPDVAGPIGIARVIARAVQSDVRHFISLIAYISVALGLFNLFPVPLLDGGHVVYYLIEGIRRKPLSPQTMGRANMVGLALLLTLLAFATINDFTREFPASDNQKSSEQK